jgi:hypothetical protein
MEETPEVQEDLGGGGKFKNWLQDNIRIILSVLIVVAIAAGIYSYSKRTEVPIGEEEIAIDEFMEEEEDAVTIIGDDDEDQMEADEIAMDDSVTISEAEEDSKIDEVIINDQVEESQTAISEETDEAFIESAARGDSRTTLARKALRNYLEKNNDSSLTAEHKIYIEDYLQKTVGHTSGVNVGTQISFSKTHIRDAIEKSKTLTESQLNNLTKYAQRVPNL